MRYSKEQLEPIVKKNVSVAGVIATLGLRQSGGNHSHLKSVFSKLKISTEHFKGQGANCGDKHVGGLRQRTYKEVLVLRSPARPREKGSRLRKALIESGREYKCVGCGVENTYNSKPIVLQPDHENGKPWDNRPKNLNFKCPNCHSQTPTFAGRNKGHVPVA